MRITGGRFRSRLLRAPAGLGTRPTSDRVREALFSVLMHRGWLAAGTPVVDAYAGTGALGLEALSRGASTASFIEGGAAARKALMGNIASLGVERSATVVPMTVERALTRAKILPAPLVFLDPPYEHVKTDAFEELLALAAHAWLTSTGVLVLEHAARDRPPEVGTLFVTDARNYGDTAVAFYERKPKAESAGEAAKLGRGDAEV